MELFDRIQSLEKQVHLLEGKRQTLRKQEEQQEKQMIQIDETIERIALKKMLLEEASEEARESGKNVLSETCTNAVQIIQGPKTRVDMELANKSGQATATLFVENEDQDGNLITTIPTEGEGGGIADIVSLATFFSLGMLAGSQNKAPYFLDEPTKYVSKGKSENVAKFLTEMMAFSGKQTLLVTHDAVVAQAGDKVFEVQLDADTHTSLVREVTN